MRRNRIDHYTSDVTVEEAGKGNPDAGALRLGALSGIPILPTTEGQSGCPKALQLGRAPDKGDAMARIRVAKDSPPALNAPNRTYTIDSQTL
jgi:hypothetical protein